VYRQLWGVRTFLRQATLKDRFNKNFEEAMTNVLITRSNRPDTGTPEVAVIEAAAEQQELASTGPGGVLKELALARWRGLTRAPSNPRAGDASDR